MSTIRESADSDVQEFTFQAEIKQLLHLLAHSLYQTREIAVRELVSNASDSLDKLRFLSLTGEAAIDVGAPEIVIETRRDPHELIIRDNGVGMTREELVTNLGTIARSGSLEFLKSIAKDKESSKGDVSLIGQFGVGFYSAFMLADRVRVRTRSLREEGGWEWVSDGSGTFTISPVVGLERGAEVILRLKDDAKEFAQDYRVKEVLQKYSTFIPHPIRIGSEVVNTQKPIWVEPKNQVSDEQHEQFYQHLTHHTSEKPLWRLHASGEYPIQYKALLYCPPVNLERIGFYRRSEHGLNLCAKRVLVQANCQELLPEYLRFLHGLVDSEDLPLNVSRETLQDDTIIRKIRSAVVKSLIDRLQLLATEEPETFATFTKQFGIMIKEGVVSDHANKDKLAKLLRFASTRSEDRESLTSLDEYASRCLPDQKAIYYLGGPDLAAVTKNPSLEIFRRRGIEVLFLTDPIDEFVMSSLYKYGDKELQSIDSSDIDLPAGDGEPEPAATESGGVSRLIGLFKEALGDRVTDVRESKRLTDSPCCLVNVDGGMSVQMQRILRLSNQDVPETKRILEINPRSPLIDRLSVLSANDDHREFIKQCGLQLWTNALILEGVLIEPESLVSRVQKLMEETARGKTSIIL